MHFDVDIDGEDYCHSVKYGTGLLSWNHMQTIGKNLVLGFELMHLTERKLSLFNYAGKYSYKNHAIYG